MLTLLGYTIALAVASLAITKAFNGSFRAAGTAYWTGWTILALCTVYVEWRNLVPAVDDEAIAMVEQAHTVAFFAFLAGAALASGTKKRMRREPVERLVESERIVRRFSRPWLIFLALSGLAFLIQQVLTVGLNLSGLMTDLRSSYLLAGTLSLPGKIYAYFSTTVLVAAVILARSDRLYGIRVKRLVVLVSCMSFGGFAMGGRGFLLAPLFVYFVAYLMLPKISQARSVNRAVLNKQIIAYLLAASVVFSVMGEWRWGTESVNEDSAFYVRVIDSPATWIATSMRGITPYVKTFAYTDTEGRAFLEWPASQLERLGLLSTDTQRDLQDVRSAVRATYGEPVNFPPTIIPFLYGDWGEAGWLIAYFIICLATQFLTLSLDSFNLASHFICTILMLGMLYTIQAALLFSANNCVSLLGFVVFRLLLSFTGGKTSLVNKILPRAVTPMGLGSGRLSESK